MRRHALDGAALRPAAGADAMRGEALGELARRYLLAEAVIDRLARIIDADALRAVLDGCVIDLANEQAAMGSAARLARAMAKYTPTTSGDAPVVRPRFDDRHEKWLLAVSYTHLRAHQTVLDLDCRLLLEKTQKGLTVNRLGSGSRTIISLVR